MGVVVFYVSWGQFRLYRSRLAHPEPNRVVAFERRTHPFATLFSPTRTPVDSVHLAAAGFTYASGQNPNTGTRYRVASIPIWLPAAIALLIFGALLLRRLTVD